MVRVNGEFDNRNADILPLDHDSIYSGRVFGESQSSVRAHIEDKMITANIVLPDETYHIEVSASGCVPKCHIQMHFECFIF